MTIEAALAHSGRRERNKQDKLRRIKGAARDLFIAKGFDDATMREIALRSGVGLGTLFSYASNKRDLLFLIYNDDQDVLNRESVKRADEKRTLLARLVALFSVYYEFGAKQPVFMRYALREMTFYAEGRQAGRFTKGRDAIIERVEWLVAAAKKTGELQSSERNQTIARVFFAVYQAEIRRWLLDKHPKPAEGLRLLRRALRIPISGLHG